MKKIFFTMMLMLAVTAGYAAVPALSEFPAFSFDGNNVRRLPAAKQATPVELKEFKQSTFECAYFDWWYFGNSEADGIYFGYVLFNEEGKEVAFTVLTPSETDYVTYLDGVTFKEEEDRDVSQHYYISTYWILNSLNGVRLGGADEDKEVIQKCIKEVSTNTSSMLALRSGTYYLRIYEMYIADGSASIGSGYDQVKFTMEGVELKELKAEVANDKKSATISWVEPDPEDMPAGAHLYLSVQSGSDVVFDNGSSRKSPDNPLTVNVDEGRTYKVIAQYVTSSLKPLGSELTISFSVGTNEYIPTNPTATVSNDDQVEFTWGAAKKAEYYGVDVYQDGFIYASYTASDTKLTKTLPEGSYSWEVAAFEKGSDGLVYRITEFVKGNDFTTKTAPLPEGTVEMNVWGMEAFYMKDYASDGNYPWLITLETGTSGGTGLPEVWIIVWSNREFGLSGYYSSKVGNIEVSATAGEGSLINTNGTEAGLITANEVELRLEFDGFEMEYTQMGYYIPYYSGSFIMSCADGKTYHGTMNQFLCGTYDYSELTASSRSILYSMYDEMEQGLEEIVSNTGKGAKYMIDGQLVIERNGVLYNAQGTRIK